MFKQLSNIKTYSSKLLTLGFSFSNGKCNGRPRLNSSKPSWNFIEPSPPDPIHGLTVLYNKDTNNNKVNLGVGAYKDSEGKPFVLQSVKNAQIKQLDKDFEYAPIEGIKEFIEATQKLAFGNNPELCKRTATVQTLSGTGSLRLGAEFLRHNKNQMGNQMGNPIVYIPEQSWPNHKNILIHSNLKFNTYSYLDKSSININFNKMIDSLKFIDSNSVILFHACAHNPTGTDPTIDQWKELSKVCKYKNHLVWFDSAYQGFASGDPNQDAQSYNLFINDGHNIILSQSYAKNMGLYGLRIGALSIVTDNQEQKTNVLNKLKSIIRPIYSSPPLEGARIVSEIINNKELNELWHKEVKLMADRIGSMRTLLKEKLEKNGSKKDWSHITRQIGMFCYTGLNTDQVNQLINQYHIYLTSDGRISMAGITPKNIDYVAKSIHLVTK